MAIQKDLVHVNRILNFLSLIRFVPVGVTAGGKLKQGESLRMTVYKFLLSISFTHLSFALSKRRRVPAREQIQAAFHGLSDAKVT